MSHFSPDMRALSPRPGGHSSRALSISSDRPSTAGQSVMSPPLSVSPEAAFIAASAASQIVTNDHDSHADTWYDQHGFQPSGESVVVSSGALRHLNNFLDHLLFNFLAISGSTALSKLRPAVSDVLKPKLAKDAINNADEELREYLGGGDDEEFLQSPASATSRDWDLELVWKRTRLRCMVYSSLGDMEEEDEDHHMEEGLLGDDNDTSNVSPAVAIFLTSILEYLGEQALVSAGQASWNRMRIKYEKEPKDDKRRSDTVDRIFVEDFDMERVALDRTLGRLWRAWKKRVRSGPGSVDLTNRSASLEKMYRARHGSLASHDENSATAVEGAKSEPGQVAKEELAEDEQAAAVPVPIGDRDVDEIEVPGLVHYSDDEAEEEDDDALDLGTRPKSMMILPCTYHAGLPTPDKSRPTTPAVPTRLTRKRANSLPIPAATPYAKREKLSTEATEVVNAAEGSNPTEEVAAESSPEQLEKAVMSDEVAQPTAKDDDSDAEPIKMSHRLSGPLTGAAAAAAASATMAAALEAPNKQLAPTKEDDESESEDEEIEEARIMTSSRISIGGSLSDRSDSPANSDRSRSARPPLTISTMPVRSGSLRLVNVSSPRTPSTRSQMSSSQQDQNNSSNYSRSVSQASSYHAQHNGEESTPVDEIRAQRFSGTSAVGKPRSYLAPPISEEELPASARDPVVSVREVDESRHFPRDDDSPARSVDEPAYQERTSSRAVLNQPMFGSVKRHSPVSPQTSPKSGFKQQRLKELPATQVTMLSSSPESDTTSSYTGEDEVGPLPLRQPKQSPRLYSQSSGPTSPAVPEKSRYRHGHSQSGGAPSPNVGIVSVDRAANGEIPRTAVGTPSVHTPASSASSNKVRTARVSQDSTVAKPDELVKDFEDLIKSNETIQYTLTSENMREIEVSSFSQAAEIKTLTSIKGSPRSLGGKANKDRAGSASTNKPIVEIRRSASVTRATGLRSHPIDVPAEDKARPPVSMSKRRGPTPQARDARLPRESILEFADFIRATGPPGAEAAPAQPNASLRRNQSTRTTGSPVIASHVSKTSLGRPVGGGSGIINRARLQARDATVDANDNSDLIDFIRQGPSSNGTNPRIPRTVAPFRTTMDSDQMQSAVGGRARDASLTEVPDTRASQASKASTNATELSAPSIQSSVNSQSALLGRQQVAAQAGGQWDESDMMPVRKQRRVRDPYALDFTDEEEEDEDQFDYQPVASKRKPPPKEESLMDFLNSVAPPSPADPVPFALPRTQTAPVKTAAPKRKGSVPSLMSRFRQNTTGGTQPPPVPSYGSTTTTTPNAGSTHSASKNSNNRLHSGKYTSNSITPTSIGSNKGYIPIQVNIPTGGDLFPSYGKGSINGIGASSPPPTNTSSSRPSGRVPMKKFEPRDAVSVPTRGTSDLAEFLKNSEPPGGMGGTASWSRDDTPSADSGGSRLFGRRKKSTGFA